MTAGQAGGGRIVATVGESVVDAEGGSLLNDLGLGEVDERGVDVEASALDAGPGGDVGERLEGLDEDGATVGITAVIDGIDADVDVEGADLGVGQGQGKEDGVARGRR